jgi:hypothetical protein
VKTYVIYVPAVVQVYAPLRFKRKVRHERKAGNAKGVMVQSSLRFSAHSLRPSRLIPGRLGFHLDTFYVKSLFSM